MVIVQGRQASKCFPLMALVTEELPVSDRPIFRHSLQDKVDSGVE